MSYLRFENNLRTDADSSVTTGATVTPCGLIPHQIPESLARSWVRRVDERVATDAIAEAGSADRGKVAEGIEVAAGDVDGDGAADRAPPQNVGRDSQQSLIADSSR